MISLTSTIETWAHARPAGAKLAALSLATVGLFTLNDPRWLALALLGVVALYLSGGRAFTHEGARALRILWPFLVLIALWHGITGQIAEGLAVALRLLAALALANFVTLTTRLSDMIDVASRLLAPLRRWGVSTRALEVSVAMVVRFIPAIAENGRHLGDAWRARAPHRARWQVVMPLAALAIDDAEHVAEALKARGGLLSPIESSTGS